MAMSQGERMARLLEQQGRYRTRQQTTSSWNHTREIVQPRASGTVFPETRTPTNYAIQGSVVRQGSEVPGGLDSSITKNVYSANGAPIGCCATYVTSGTETYDEQNALIQKAQGCAVCSPVNSYWLSNGYAIDMSGTLIKGGWTCPIPNLVNTAKTTAAEQCASCLNFYFPSPAQPRVCASCGDPALLSNQRYGDAGVPIVPQTKTAY
jgi:hypothetical protein